MSYYRIKYRHRPDLACGSQMCNFSPACYNEWIQKGKEWGEKETLIVGSWGRLNKKGMKKERFLKLFLGI